MARKKHKTSGLWFVCSGLSACEWPAKKKSAPSRTPWSHTNIWPMHGLRLGIYHQRSALGYFRLMSWDSSVSSVSSDLWDWSWDLNVGHSTQARGPSCAMLLGALQTWWEVVLNVTLERCWTMLKHVEPWREAAPGNLRQLSRSIADQISEAAWFDLKIPRIVGWCHKILRSDFFQNPFLVVPNSCTWWLGSTIFWDRRWSNGPTAQWTCSGYGTYGTSIESIMIQRMIYWTIMISIDIDIWY